MNHFREPEVAVTGMGLVTPAGDTLASFWAGLCSGVPTATPLSLALPRELPVRFGCQIPGFDPAPVLGQKATRRMDRFCQLAVVSGASAIVDAGLDDVDSARAGIAVGTGIGGVATLERFVISELGYEPGLRRNPLTVPMAMFNAAAGQLAVRTGWAGPNLTITTACASGAQAIGEAARMIRNGTADVMLAGGAEAPLIPFSLIGFHHVRALSTRNEDPASASRPFDEQRDGFVLGEGAAFVVLESVAHARARDARIWAYLHGYGNNNDAFDMIMPDPSGNGARKCMQLALEDAGAQLSDVLFISAHGTSTVLNDRTEAQAIRQLFGSQAPPVTSNKGVTGHSLGAAGAMEFVAACLSLSESHIPPTANYGGSESQIDIEVVSGGGLPCKSSDGLTMSNSFGFGGNNACLVIQGGQRTLDTEGEGRD